MDNISSPLLRVVLRDFEHLSIYRHQKGENLILLDIDYEKNKRHHD